MLFYIIAALLSLGVIGFIWRQQTKQQFDIQSWQHQLKESIIEKQNP